MWRQDQNLLRRTTHQLQLHLAASSSSPSLSIWRRKKEMGKEGLMVAKELKRLQNNPVRFERFMKTNVSRLLKSDLVAVLVEFQRQNLVPLSMKFVQWCSDLRVCSGHGLHHCRGSMGKSTLMKCFHSVPPTTQ
ncbi:hypothetical protein ACS0TY_033798 [Phlomoides rotata]